MKTLEAYILFLIILLNGNNIFSQTSDRSCFIENVGQINSLESRLSIPEIKYFFKTKNTSVYFWNDKISFLFVNSQEDTKKWDRIDLEFVNCNKNSDVKANKELQYKEIINYPDLLNKTARSYKELMYENIYDNIDLKIIIDNKSFKYEFIVHKNGVVDDIQINYKYSDKPTLTYKNELLIKNNKVSFYDNSPIAYQDNDTIKCNWRIEENGIVSYMLNNYDITKDLIIDPSFYWSTLYGDVADEVGKDLYTIGGNSFVTGKCNNALFPLLNPGNGAYFQGTYGGGDKDVFIMKFDPEGVLKWSSFLGGTQDEESTKITGRDSSIFVCGKTSSSNFPLLNPGNGAYFQSTYSGVNEESFIAEFDTSGKIYWSTFYGGNNYEEGQAIYANNNEIIFGITTNSTNLPVVDLGSGSYFQNINNGNWDAYFVSFNNNRQIQWASYFGGTNNEYGQVSLSANQNNIFATWTTLSTDLLIINSSNFIQSSNNGMSDAFILCLNQNKSINWSTYFGGSASDSITNIIAGDTILFICGNSYSTNIPLYNPGSPAFFNNINQGLQDGFISELSNNGHLLWSTYFGGNKPDEIKSITIDTQYVWITGNTLSPLPVYSQTSLSFYQPMQGGFIDGFIAQFRHSNHFKQYCSYLGGEFDDNLVSIVSDNEYIYLTGYSLSHNIPLFTNDTISYYQELIDLTDVFIGKMDVCFMPLLEVNSTSNYLCRGESSTLTVSNADAYLWSTGATNNSINVSPLNSAEYLVTCYNNEGCFDSTSFFLEVKDLPDVLITGQDSVCIGDTIELYAQGANIYSWLPVVGSDSNLVTIANNISEFYVLGTDSFLCENTDTFHVNILPVIDISITGNQSICIGDTIILEASGAPLFFWEPLNISGNQIEFIPDSSMDIYITGSYQLGCSVKDTVHINVLPLPIIEINGPTSSCYGDTINLIATGADNYYWENLNLFGDTIQIILLNDTVVTVIGSIGQCESSTSFSISLNPPSIVEIHGPSIACENTEITLIATGTSSYFWPHCNCYSDNISLQISSDTLISVIGFDLCPDTEYINISVYPTVYVNISGPTTLCENDSALLYANGANNYLWNPGGETADSIYAYAGIDYSVTGTDLNGCIGYNQHYIDFSPSPDGSVDDPEIPPCPGQPIILSISTDPSNTITWPDSSNNTSLNFIPTGDTIIIAQVCNGCCIELSSPINYQDYLDATSLFDLTLLPDSAFFDGEPIQFSVDNPGNYLYSISSPDSIIFTIIDSAHFEITSVPYNLLETSISINFSDNCGGKADTAIVIIDCGDVFIPDAFSPNNDGINDVFKVYGRCVVASEINIINKQGQQMFYGLDSWDGTYQGTVLNNDIFKYHINVVTFENDLFITNEYTGYISIIN